MPTTETTGLTEQSVNKMAVDDYGCTGEKYNRPGTKVFSTKELR